MCGFTGIAWGPRPESRLREAVTPMSAAIRHRGPNSEGRISTPFCEVGFRRLSIVDLEGGHQPLGNADGSIEVFLNGEIYNHEALRTELSARGHVLRTRADTEVLPYLWQEEGPACLRRLNGMFAVCVVDHRAGEVWVARDRLGIKPMFVAERPEGVLFGSELKALLASGLVPRELDPTQVPRFLDTLSAGGRSTLVRGVERLLPGELLHVAADGKASRRTWYDLATELAEEPRPTTRQEVLEALEDSVRLRLVADVPVGVSLSGGIDSSTLAYLAHASGHGAVRAFTVDFDDAPREELACARAVAEHLDLEHVVVRSTTSDFVDQALACAWTNDEPVADPAYFPALKLAQAASQEVTVLLAGTGADELFAGYGHHRLTAKGRGLAALPAPMCGLGTWVASRFLGVDAERARALTRYRQDRLPLHQLAMTHLTAAEHRLLVGPGDVARAPLLAAAFTRAPGGPGLAQQLFADTVTYLPDQLLPLLDRTTMAPAVEGRVPFLDHRVVELGLRLPEADTLGPTGGKRILREWLRGRVPDAVLDRKKLGFPNGVEGWLRGELGDLVGPILRDPDGLVAQHLPAAFVDALVGDRARLVARWPVVHALLVLQLWHRVHLLEPHAECPTASLRDVYRVPGPGRPPTGRGGQA